MVEDETRPEVVRAALNRAERNALEAHRMYVVAKVEFDAFELECAAYMANFRHQVITNFENDATRKKKTITEADMTAGLMEFFPDQTKVETERREKMKATVAQYERLAKLWEKRTFALQKLAG